MENMELETVEQNNVLATTEDLENAIKQAERREELVRKIKILAIKQTNKNDFVDMGGKPYLQASGAEKIARLFGISWKICEGYPKKETITDEKGTYYMYTYKGEFTMGGKSIEIIGTCSQKDKFLGTQGNKERPASEIDETNIIKKANTNMIARGITTILGIRNLTWDEVNQGGVEQKQTSKVTYATGGAGGGKISDAQAKRLFAIMKSSGMPEEQLKKYLKEKYKVESSKEINRSDYEAICAYVQGQETAE